MTRNIPLQCTCGVVTGRAIEVHPDRGNRLVCMCDDCQAYARWLGRADELLDANGGTDIFQLTPAQVKIETGREQIRCVRLSDKGLLRWHTGCCKTPIANTMASARVPFLGMPWPFMNHAGDGCSRDEALGPVLARIHGRFGQPPLPAGSHARAPLGLILRSLRQLGRGLIAGAHAPSPLFDAEGAPIHAPTVLSAEQRARLCHADG